MRTVLGVALLTLCFLPDSGQAVDVLEMHLQRVERMVKQQEQRFEAFLQRSPAGRAMVAFSTPRLQPQYRRPSGKSQKKVARVFATSPDAHHKKPASRQESTDGSFASGKRAQPTVAVIDERQFEYYLAQAGWPSELWGSVKEVARCESSWRPDIISEPGPKGSDYGLLQVNHYSHRDRVPDPFVLLDPVENLRFSHQLFREFGWKPWKASNRCHRLLS